MSLLTKQTFTQAINEIRTNLLAQSALLRRLDSENSEIVAQKLDRLRSDLKRFAEN